MLIVGLAGVIVVLGLVFVVLILGQGAAPPQATQEGQRINALAESTDNCVVCHSRTTPGIVEQYGHRTMAAAEVGCRDCHEGKADYPGAIEHEDTFVLGAPTRAMCKKCHANQVAQFNQSRHGLSAMWLKVGAMVPIVVGTFALLVAVMRGAIENAQWADLLIYIAAMVALMVVGAIGMVLHIQANLAPSGLFVTERFVRGAPFMAPLLFSNMGMLGLLILLDPTEHRP